MALTQDQIKQNISALETQGASQEDIQSWLDSQKGNVASSDSGQQKPGFVQGLVQDIARPFLKPIASIDSAAASAIDPAAGQNARDNGVPFGYFGNVKPFGAQGLIPQPGQGTNWDSGARQFADVAGNTAEAASYFMAPMKLGRGFWATVKEGAPMAATYAAGKGGEALGDGKSPLEAAGTAAANYVGATAGYSLLKGAGNLIANWGSRALQSDAVRVAGQWANDFAEKTWNALPEAFQKGAADTLDSITNKSTRRTVSALQDEFDKNWTTASQSMIDGINPEVNQPDLTFGKFQRSLSETMGNMFRTSNALYDDVKADQTTIGSDTFNLAKQALGKIETPPDINALKPGTPEYRDAIQALTKPQGILKDFKDSMEPALVKDMTLKNVMNMWDNAMSYIPQANNEERGVIRDFAAGLYSDARTTLEKTNPDLLNGWDGAYQAWKKASDLYSSGFLGTLKSSGDVDTVVDTMLKGGMTRPEQTAFLDSIKGNEGSVQNLFINSLLRKAKAAPTPEEGAGMIQKFLDGWDVKAGENSFLTPAQAKQLDDISSFMGGKFDDFVLGMRKAQGLGDEVASEDTVAKLSDQQGNLDIAKAVNDGRMSDIADKFYKLKDSPDLSKILSALSPEERQVVGLSIGQKVLDNKVPVASLNKDGTYKINSGFAKAVVDTYDDIASNRTLNSVLTDEQLNGLKQAADSVRNLTEVPVTGMKRILHGILAVVYGAKGFFGAAIQHGVQGVSAPAVESKAYYEAVDNLIDQGLLEGNKRILVGDFLKKLLPLAGQAFDKLGSEITGEND